MFIVVIAYQLVQVIRSAYAHGEHACWPTLRRTLEWQQRVTGGTFRRPAGRPLHVRTATQLEPDQRAI